MANPIEHPPEPEPLPRNVAAETPRSSFISKAVYDVAFKIGGADFASQVTSHNMFDHERALQMLEIKNINARAMVQARLTELLEFTENHVSKVRKVAAKTMQILRWPL